MSVEYTFTATIKGWKRYDCAGCGCDYRYLYERTVSGKGGSKAQARQKAEDAVAALVQEDSDEYPCPECGLIQPRVIQQGKLTRYSGATAAIVVFCGLFLILGATDVMNRGLAAWLIAGISLLVLFGHVDAIKWDPNRDRKANKKRATEGVKSGKIEILYPGRPDDVEPQPPGYTAGHGAFLLMVMLSIVAALVVPFVRAKNGWTLDSSTDPVLFGPGDTIKLKFPDEIDCVAEHWAGSVVARIENAAELGVPPTLHGTSRADSWGGSMMVKRSQEHTHPTLWAEITFPADERLAWKTVRVSVDLTVLYPTPKAGSGLENVQKVFHLEQTLKLASASAWHTYRRVWWTALLVSLGLSLAASLGLSCMAMVAKHKTSTAVIEPFESNSDEEDEDEEKEEKEENKDKKKEETEEKEEKREKQGRDSDDSSENAPPDKPWKRGK